MSPLYRLKVAPCSPWRTPWHADTLTGALLATCARVHGSQLLRNRLIDPMLAGTPPFVLSDALPSELLPAPIILRMRRYPDGTNLKAIKRGRWLAPAAFAVARAGGTPVAADLIRDIDVFLDHTRQHNTLSRLTDSSDSGETEIESAIGLYQKSDTLLRNMDHQKHLTLYFHFASTTDADLLLELLHELSLTGFGADTSTGRGQFDLPDDPATAPELESPPPGANGVISLSTFQPGPGDPTDGFWEAFPKFGKLGPGLGLDEHQILKHTLIMFRPGGCFVTDPTRAFLGHAIDTERLVPPDAARSLLARDLRVIHPAFGLMIPAVCPKEDYS